VGLSHQEAMMLLPTIANEKERHTATAREEQRPAGPEGACDFSQGWSEAQPLVRGPPGTFRPDRGGVGFAVRIQGFRFAPPLATFGRPFGVNSGGDAQIELPPALPTSSRPPGLHYRGTDRSLERTRASAQT